jgi:hypothetical protein
MTVRMCFVGVSETVDIGMMNPVSYSHHLLLFFLVKQAARLSTYVSETIAYSA